MIGFLRDVATAAADFGNGSDPEASRSGKRDEHAKIGTHML